MPQKSKLDCSTLFFNTDHHWKPTTAFWTAGEICHYFNEKYNTNIDETLYDIDRYSIKTYKDWFLGSLGKRVGIYYAGTDDFDVITPRFDTSFSFYAKTEGGKEEYRNGDFKETMIVWDYLREKDYFDLNPYASYIGNDYAINTIINNNTDNKLKVLLIRDSYSCALAPFIALGVKELTTIDLRHYFDMSVEDYIKNHYYDIIMVAYNPTAASIPDNFTFFSCKKQ